MASKNSKVVTGKFRKDSITCPDWLSVEARACWDEIVPLLEEEELLLSIDATVLAMYCDTYVKYIELTKQLKSMDDYFETAQSGYKQQSATFVVRFKLMEHLLKLSKEFAMTPRVRVTRGIALPKPKKKATDWDGF